MGEARCEYCGADAEEGHDRRFPKCSGCRRLERELAARDAKRGGSR